MPAGCQVVHQVPLFKLANKDLYRWLLLCVFLLDALLHTRSELPHSFFTTTRLTACHVDLDLALDLLCFKSVQSLLFLMNPPIVILL